MPSPPCKSSMGPLWSSSPGGFPQCTPWPTTPWLWWWGTDHEYLSVDPFYQAQSGLDSEVGHLSGFLKHKQQSSCLPPPPPSAFVLTSGGEDPNWIWTGSKQDPVPERFCPSHESLVLLLHGAFQKDSCWALSVAIQECLDGGGSRSMVWVEPGVAMVEVTAGGREAADSRKRALAAEACIRASPLRLEMQAIWGLLLCLLKLGNITHIWLPTMGS